ncbi:MAG: hypothetical protein RLZZ500_1110 [Bacteroidota bacterium]|jgi:multidrug efflux pump subunit AcrA (membrane-fusion protein)
MKKIVVFAVFMSLVACQPKGVIHPERKDIEALVFASGQLEWEDTYSVMAQTEGILTDFTIETGQTVTKNQIVAHVDNPTNRNNEVITAAQMEISDLNITSAAPALLQLEQTIQIAENKYAQDQKVADRYSRLHQQNIGSTLEYENAQLAAKNSLSSLKSLQKQYQLLKQQAQQQRLSTKMQLQNNRIQSGYNSVVIAETGTVLQTYKNKGDYVRKGDVLAKVGNAQKIEAVLNVDESSIGQVQVGQSVFVRLNTHKQTTYRGTLTEIEAAFDLQSQSFLCKVRFDKPISKPLYGTQLEANIVVGKKNNALLIPRTYLGYGNTVHVKGNDQPVKIKTGIISSEYVEVRSGIDANTELLPLKP